MAPALRERAAPSHSRPSSSSHQSRSLSVAASLSQHNDSLQKSTSSSADLMSFNLYSKDANSFVDEDESSWHTNADMHRSLDSIEKINGIHYVDIHLGDPAQKQTLAVITSSDHSVLSSCSTAPAPSASRTFNRLRCDECSVEESKCVANRCQINGFISKPENSWYAYEAMDFVYIGGQPLEDLADGSSIAITNGLPIIFGCQIESAKFSNQILSNSDGIMGMSPSRTSFVNQMYANDKISANQFSLCFNRIRPDLRTESEEIPETGALTFGGYDSTHHTTPMLYAENTRWNGASYSVYVENIFLRAGGGQSVIPNSASQELTKIKFDAELFNAVGHGVLIESSSPYTLLISQIRDEFRLAWRTITGEEYSYDEVSLTEEELNSLPTIIFQFKAPNIGSDNKDNIDGMIGTYMDVDSPHDAFLAVPATQYMEFIEATQKYRSRISLESNSGSIIGANALQGKQINFDLDNSRIGFAEQISCDQPIIKKPGENPTPGFVMAKTTGELAATLPEDGDFAYFSFNNVYIGALSFLLLVMFVLIGTAIRKSR